LGVAVSRIILIAILLLSFDLNSKESNNHDSSHLFAKQISTFEYYSGIGVRIPVVLYRFPYNWINGECISIYGIPTEVRISALYYETYGKDSLAIEQLVIHELGHCVLQYAHDESVIPKDGQLIERSIMSSKTFGYEPYYKKYREYYLQEFFGRNYGNH
jgi:hypothetical protein